MPAFAPPSADTLVSDQPWSVNESEFNPPPPDSLVKFEPPSANTLQGTVDPRHIALGGDIDKHPEQAPQERPRGIDEWLGEKLNLDKNTIPDALHTIGSFMAAYDPDTATADENPEAKFSRLMELPSRPPTKGEQVAGGLINSLNRMTASMADPVNAALLVTGAVGPAIAARAVSAYFFKHMFDAGPEVWTRAGEISVIGDTQEKTEAYADAGMTFMFTVLAGAHAGKKGLANEVPALRDALRKRVETDYTAAEVRDLYQRVSSGKGTPEEQALVMELYQGARAETNPLRVRKVGERGATTERFDAKISEDGAIAKWLGLESTRETAIAQKTAAEVNLAEVAPATAKAVETPPVLETTGPGGVLVNPETGGTAFAAPLTDAALKAAEPRVETVSLKNETITPPSETVSLVSETKPATVETPATPTPVAATAGKAPKPNSPFFLRPRRDGVPDILDAIQELGGIRTPRENSGGEYDGYAEAVQGPAKVLRRTRGGQSVDKLMQELESTHGYRFESTDQFWDAVSKASASREALRDPTQVELADKFQRAALGGEGRSVAEKGSLRINSKDLAEGDRIKIKGEWFDVAGREGETLFVKGERSGSQQLPDNTPIHLDRGGLEKPTPKPAEPAPEAPKVETAPVIQPSVADILIEGLTKAKTPLDSGLPTGGLPQFYKAARNTAIDIVIAGIRVGQTLAQAVEYAITYLRGQHGEFDDAGIREDLTKAAEGVKPTAKTPLGIKNADTERAREGMGLEPVEKPARQPQEEVQEEGNRQLADDKDAAVNLAETIIEKPRVLTPKEDAVLKAASVKESNEVNLAAQDVLDAAERGDSAGIVAGRIRQAVAQERYDAISLAADRAGTEWGRAGAFRQRQLENDYSLAAITTKLRSDRARPDEPLSEADLASIDAQAAEFAKRIADTEKGYQEWLKDHEAKIAEREGELVLKGIGEEPTVSRYLIDMATRLQTKLKADRIQALKELQGMSFNIAAALPKLARVGADMIAEVGLDFGKWQLKMIEAVGERIKPHLAAVWEASQEYLEKAGKTAFGNQNGRKVVDRITKTDTIAEQEAKLKKQIQKKIEKARPEPGQPPPENAPDISIAVQKLAKIFVAQGTRRLHPLIDQLHGVLKEFDPEITWRETMDAFTGYGKFKKLSMDELSVEVRKIKGEGQQTAKLLDAFQEGKMKPTGIERRTPDQIERGLIKIVNQMKKVLGVTVKDSATVLKSYLEGRKTYYRNRLEDLRSEIAARTSRPNDTSTLPTDPELDALKAELKTVKAEHDSIFNATGEAQIKAALAAVERQSARYAEIIRTGKLPEPKEGRTKATSPELEAARAHLESLKEQAKLLPEIQALEIAKELTRVEARAAEVERQINEGDTAAKPSAALKLSTPELTKARAELAELNKIKAQMQSAAKRKSPSEVEAKKLADLDAKINALVDKINAGDISTAAKPAKPVSAEMAAKRAELAELNKIRQQLRNAAKPKMTEAEISLRNYKATQDRRKADYLDRIARGDFATRTIKPRPLDAEGAAKKVDADNAKQKFENAREVHRAKNMTGAEKAWANFIQAIGLSQNMRTAYDISAVGRQGGFIGAASPDIAAIAGVQMIRAIKNEKTAQIIEQQILSRHNAANYAKDKLYLAPLKETRLHAQEEATIGSIKLAAKIPGLRASNRAYNTFLNYLRADKYDVMTAKNTARNGGVIDPGFGRDIAAFINMATGRGELGRFEHLAGDAASVIFSPRLNVSRLQMLIGYPIYRGVMTKAGRAAMSMQARKMIAWEYGKTMVGISAMLSLGVLALGAAFETDPLSSDYGKLKFGNSRLDILMGFQQYLVLINRLVQGETKSLRTGKITPIRGEVPYGGRDAFDVMSDFGRSKLRPITGTAIDILAGENVVGEPTTLKSVIENLTVPMAWDDIIPVMEEHGPIGGTTLQLMELLGGSVQHFDVNKNKEKQK